MEELIKSLPNGQWALEKGHDATPPKEEEPKAKQVLKIAKNGQWNLEADKIKPGREHSRDVNAGMSATKESKS